MNEASGSNTIIVCVACAERSQSNAPFIVLYPDSYRDC